MSNTIEIAIGVAGGGLAVEALHKVSEALEGLAAKVSPAFGAVATSAIVATGAITAFSGAVFELVKSTAEAGDHIWEVSKKLGVSAQSISELQYAAQMSGASVDDLRTAFALLSRRVNESAQGSEAAQKVFRDLNVEIRTATGVLKPVDQLFLELTDKINGLSGETEKTAKMFELFGRGGTSLLPMLKGGREEMEQLRAEARKLGITFNDVQAQQANDFNDSLIKIKSSISGLVKAFSMELMPTLTAAFDWLAEQFTQFAPKAKAFGKTLMAVFMILPEIVTEVANLAHRLLMKLFTDPDYMVGFLENATKLFNTFIAVVILIMKDVAVIILKAASIVWVPLGEAASVVIDQLRYEFDTFSDWLILKILASIRYVIGVANEGLALIGKKGFDTTGLDAWISTITNDVAKVPKTVAEAFDEGGHLIVGFFDSIKDNVTDIGKTFKDGFAVVKEVVKDFADLPEMRLFAKTMENKLNEALAKIDKFNNAAKEKMKPQGEAVQSLFDKLRTAWTSWFDQNTKSILLKADQTGKSLVTNWAAVNDRMKEITKATWQTFKQGVGDAIGNAIVYGEDLGKAFGDLMKKITASVISMLVQVGLEMIVQWAVAAALLVTETTAKLGAAIAVGTLASAAWGAALGGPVGAGLAAAAFLALVPEWVATSAVMAAATAPIAVGGGAAHGGLESVPAESTYLLQRGERVLSPNQNKDLKDFMAQRQGGAVVIQTLNILPNSSIDEALMSKPVNWWMDMIRKNILPATNALGDMGYSTTLKQRRSKQ